VTAGRREVAEAAFAIAMLPAIPLLIALSTIII
jgi:hypothetical protein